MRMLKDLQLMFMRNFRKTMSQPVWLFLGLLQPVLYLLLYMPLLKNVGNSSSLPLSQIAQIFVPGMLIIMGMGTMFAGFGFIPEIRQGFITRLLVTPASRTAILISYVLNQQITLVLQGLIILVISYFLGLRISLFAAIMALLLMSLIGVAMSCFSYIVSLETKTEDALAPIVNTIYLPIMLLSGIMLPISLAPEWLQNAAHFNPFYFAVEGTRALFLGKYSDPIILESFVIMAVFAVIAVWFAQRSLRRMTA